MSHKFEYSDALPEGYNNQTRTKNDKNLYFFKNELGLRSEYIIYYNSIQK